MSEKALRYTLLTEGSSDTALLPILTWLLETYLENFAIQPTWAELRELPVPPTKLTDKIVRSIDLYPCELLFVHRDSDRHPHEHRVAEIREALREAAERGVSIPSVCVVPIRMQEAWLLVEETAIREAAGNRNGHQRLELPHLKKLESIPDPKQTLYELLRAASGLSGRRLHRFNESLRARRVADFIIDFSVLRYLSAFQYLEEELQFILQEQGWKTT